MEEAGNKVETNIDKIKSDYAEKINKLENIIKKVGKHLQRQNIFCSNIFFFFRFQMQIVSDAQSKKSQMSEMKIKAMENKMEQILEASVGLDTDLQVASKTIVICSI